MRARRGDKVQVKCGKHRGKRGVVVSAKGSEIIVRLDMGQLRIFAKSNELTNYSLAARKAWVSMPDRRVGRPAGSSKTPRISVTLRLDLELWMRFKRLESMGLIEDRTAVINVWLRERVGDLETRSETKGVGSDRREPEDG